MRVSERPYKIAVDPGADQGGHVHLQIGDHGFDLVYVPGGGDYMSQHVLHMAEMLTKAMEAVWQDGYDAGRERDFVPAPSFGCVETLVDGKLVRIPTLGVKS